VKLSKFKNIIIAPYCKVKELNAKNYNKKVVPTIFCPDDEWYYFNKTGQLRQVHNNKIYASILDNDGWPSGLLRRIR
jgi:hypothetical protein